MKYVQKNADRAAGPIGDYIANHEEPNLEDNPGTVVADFVADVLHWAVQAGADPDQVVHMALVHYRAEAGGEDDWPGNDSTPVEAGNQEDCCPECGSEDLDVHVQTSGDGVIEREVECLDCGEYFDQVFTVSGNSSRSRSRV